MFVGYVLGYLIPGKCNDPVFHARGRLQPIEMDGLPVLHVVDAVGAVLLAMCLDFMDESHAMQVRYVVDRRLIFGLVGAVEQIDACAREPSLYKRTISVSGYHMPDHASLSMN